MKRKQYLRLAFPIACRAASERGVLLLFWALGLNMVLLIMIGSYLNFFQTVLNTTTRPYLQDQAVALADAGVQSGLWELNHNNGLFAAGWTNISGTQPCIDVGGAGAQCYQRGPLGLTATDGTNTNLGTYTVTVANPSTLTPAILAQGRVTGSSVSQSIRTTLALDSNTTFRYAGFGETLHIEQIPGYIATILLDSYNSTVGAYNPATARSNAHVGANYEFSAVASWPTYTNVVVKGNAYITPSTTGVWNTGPTGAIKGSVITQNAQTFPDVVVPAALQGLTSLGNVTLSSGTTTCSGDQRYTRLTVQSTATFVMAPGCRLYIDSPGGWDLGGSVLKILNSGRVEAQGNNQIFLNGSFYSGSSNGFVTITQRPSDLQIYAQGYVDYEHGSYMPGTIQQRQPFYGAVYVKKSGVVIRPYYSAETGFDNVAEAYGSFVGGGQAPYHEYSYTPDAAGYSYTNVHYDESLYNLSLNGTGRVTRYRTTSWQTQ